MQHVDSAPSGSKAHRPTAKQYISQLSEKIREECAQKSKQRRRELLQRHRLGFSGHRTNEQLQAEISEQIRQVAQEGAVRLLQESRAAAAAAAAAPEQQQRQQQPTSAHTSTSHSPVGAGPAASTGVASWPHIAAAPAAASASPSTTVGPWQGPGAPAAPAAGGSGSGAAPARPPLWFGSNAPEAELLESDIDAMSEEEAIRRLAEQLYTSLIAEELEAIEEEQRRHVEELAEEYEMAQQQEQQRGCSTSDRIPCPVCGRCALVQLHGVVACPAERWQLDLRVESLDLESLRERLAATYEGHAASGCPGSLRFAIESAFGSTQLVARCHTCNAMHMVI